MPAAQRPPEQDDGGQTFASDLHDAHHLKLKALLLLLWLLASFGVAFFARDLAFQIGPWPFHYWMAAQGSVLVFIALTWVYCVVMEHFERQERERGRAQPDD